MLKNTPHNNLTLSLTLVHKAVLVVPFDVYSCQGHAFKTVHLWGKK